MCNSKLSLTFFVFYVTVAMVKTEIRECIKWLLTTGKKQWKIINSQAQRVVMVTYRRWSFTRGSNCKALTRENCGVSDWQPLMEGGRLWEVVAHGGSIVQWNPTLQPPWPYGHLVVTATFFGCLAKTAIHFLVKKPSLIRPIFLVHWWPY